MTINTAITAARLITSRTTRDGGFDWHRDDQVCRDEGYSTHLIAREAVRLLREQPADKPFFLYVPFNAVHSPHQVPEKYCEPYASLPEPRRTYAGMLAAMDEAIGQILAALDARGLRTNTLIFFSSDNGGPNPGRVTSNGPLRAGKGTVYEGGTRVCACVAWPGHIKAGSAIAQPLHMVDWYPTLLKLAGASLDPETPARWARHLARAHPGQTIAPRRNPAEHHAARRRHPRRRLEAGRQWRGRRWRRRRGKSDARASQEEARKERPARPAWSCSTWRRTFPKSTTSAPRNRRR